MLLAAQMQAPNRIRTEKSPSHRLVYRWGWIPSWKGVRLHQVDTADARHEVLRQLRHGAVPGFECRASPECRHRSALPASRPGRRHCTKPFSGSQFSKFSPDVSSMRSIASLCLFCHSLSRQTCRLYFRLDPQIAPTAAARCEKRGSRSAHRVEHQVIWRS